MLCVPKVLYIWLSFFFSFGFLIVSVEKIKHSENIDSNNNCRWILLAPCFSIFFHNQNYILQWIYLYENCASSFIHGINSMSLVESPHSFICMHSDLAFLSLSPCHLFVLFLFHSTAFFQLQSYHVHIVGRIHPRLYYIVSIMCVWRWWKKKGENATK